MKDQSKLYLIEEIMEIEKESEEITKMIKQLGKLVEGDNNEHYQTR